MLQADQLYAKGPIQMMQAVPNCSQ